MLGDNHALLAQPWDPDWRCVALDDLGTPVRVEVDAECGALLHASKAHFPVLPSGATNREE